MTTQDDLKRQVAQSALRFVRAGQVLGVGTGSTVDLFIDALAAAKLDVSQAVSSSERSTAKLKAIGRLIEATAEEIAVNRRARSARLRVAERL